MAESEAERKKEIEQVFGSPDVNVPVMKFAEIEYPSFVAELSLAGRRNEDYVVHFYVPKDAVDGPALKEFWLQTFPAALSELAMSHFGAGPDRLKAAYTEEVASWWFRAYGFASEGLDPVLKITRFFDKLNQTLTTKAT
jgi:hypothetical protein